MTKKLPLVGQVKNPHGVLPAIPDNLIEIYLLVPQVLEFRES